jgi:hypothetical protein
MSGSPMSRRISPLGSLGLGLLEYGVEVSGPVLGTLPKVVHLRYQVEASSGPDEGQVLFANPLSPVHYCFSPIVPTSASLRLPDFLINV